MPYITEYSDLGPKERRQLAYKRRYKSERPDWDDSMVLLTSLVSERVTPGSSVLDAGCGHGNFVIDELRPSFSSAIGIDADPKATSKNVCLDRVLTGFLERLPFPDASFDVVTSLWVLEHVEHPETVFKEVHRVLKPGGFFAFVTPNRRSLLIRFRRLMSKRLADVLLSRFYGREDKDVFDVSYRANDVKTFHSLATSAGFGVEVLQENQDPSYTSFEPVTYAISRWVSNLDASATRPHLIGILRRPS